MAIPLLPAPPRRTLVLVTADCDGEHVIDQLAAHGHAHGAVRVVAPIVGSRLSHYLFRDEHRARPAAEQRLADVTRAFHRHGIAVTGALGDSSPLQALDDEIATFAPDELVIVAHPAMVRQWFEHHLPEEASARFGLPVATMDAIPLRATDRPA